MAAYSSTKCLPIHSRSIYNQKPLKYIILLFNLSILWSCQQNTTPHTSSTPLQEVKYAKGFSIQTFPHYQKLTIHRSFIGDAKASVYYLISHTQSIPDSLHGKNIIRVPLQKIVVTNTSHIPMLEALGVAHTLIGFPNTDYISSPLTRTRIEQGKVQELGNEQAMNTEILLNLHPDVVIGFGVDHPSKMYENIDKMGIPVIMNADWMEETPLGRAEWIKFFGSLYDKSWEAEQYFNAIDQNYQKLKKLAQKSPERPTVISGSLFQDVWYTAAGESFLAQLLRDAHAHYLWETTQGNGSLSLSLESVLEKGQDADFWMAPGDFLTTTDLTQTNTIYQKFKALPQGKTYTYAHLKGKTGGMLYFESSPLHPDWVLEDFIQIFHAEILNHTEMHYFKVLE